MNNEEPEKEVIDAEMAAKDNPSDSDHQVNLGMAYFHDGRFDEAMAAFERAIELNPTSEQAYNGIGRIRYHTGPPEKAIEAYQRAIDLNRHYIDAYYGLGILYLAQLGDFEAGLKTFQYGLEQNPDNAFLITSLGNTYARMGRFDEAIACLQQAVQIEPDNSYAFGWLSIVYLHLKRYDNVISSCQREIEIGDAHDARRLLGYAYDMLGRHDEAIVQLERSVELEPRDYEARGALAKVYRTVGRQQDAQEQYTCARERASEDDEYGQACFAAVSGNVDEALPLLEVALNKGQVQRGWVRIDPEFIFISDDPRFKALIQD